MAFTATSWAVIEIALGLRKMRGLSAFKPFDGKNPPKVSVIAPACNEESAIEPAVRALINQEYPNLEIIIVNDRSKDKTGEILKRLQQTYPQLKAVQITELPQGWLGKSNALQRGAELASGEFLIFTDADVLMEKTAVSRAVAAMLQVGLDHLSLIFKSISS